MLTKEYLKSVIAQAEFNNSECHVNYDITEIKELSEEGAYLVFAETKDDDCDVKTSFVAYEDGTCYFLTDWQGAYPKTEEEIADYKDWATVEWERLPFIFNGLPRRLY